jgi:multicomponent K+:H+ antiporter subunit D
MIATTSWLGGHALVMPIVLPLVAGALLVLLEKARSRAVVPVSLLATGALLILAARLMDQADSGEVAVYLLGNWRAPFGITLALDRLSALMLVLTALVAGGALWFSLGGEGRQGPHFHSLFQFQLMGLCGAFLTADLFNLFVFFELLLAASYGLLLHGGTRARHRAALHYVVFNLAGSALFLIAVSLLYGVAGTLNMADLAQKLPLLPPAQARLARAAVLMLLVVFAVKAALLPLYFWLPDTYAAASAPVAALFAIMTKVGVYAIARTSTLLLGPEGGPLAGVASPMLPVLALATLLLAATGALAARHLRVLVAYAVVASAGTLLLAIGLGTRDALAAGLFYLVNSTLVAALWFLLADRIATARGGTDRLEASAFGSGWAPLGVVFFAAAVAVAGVPPLAGFMGKALLLQAAGHTPLAGWVVALVLGSSLAMMMALARAGSTLFWKPGAPASAVAPAASGAGAQSASMLALLAAVAGHGHLRRSAGHLHTSGRHAADAAPDLYRRGTQRPTGARGLRCAARNARAG